MEESKFHVFWDFCKGVDVWKGILNSLQNFFYGRLVEEIKRAFAEEDVCGVDEESYEVYSGSGTLHPYYGLSKRTTTEGLQEAFSKFGEVVQAKVVTDRTSGYSKGFGFVRYGTLEDAAEGIKGMDGQFLDGWVIFAEYARPKQPPSQPQNNMGPGYGNYTNPNNRWQ
ncbi:hypothetical protein NC652_004229 [Populus alba x Populus x berolinensis]|nr:hypothetical protein NC652_004229 [Populus alba x Populus x berolinensis]